MEAAKERVGKPGKLRWGRRKSSTRCHYEQEGWEKSTEKKKRKLRIKKKGDSKESPSKKKGGALGGKKKYCYLVGGVSREK